ncbi:MAG: ABC transporter substrate-binding protein [Candidatus Humimicrobiaceae bacterium]
MLATFSLVGCKTTTAATETTVAATTTAATETTVATTTTAATETTAPVAGRVLTISGSQNWIKDADRKLAEDFTKETGVIIDIQVNPDDQYSDILKTKLNTGEAPDIFLWSAGLPLKQLPADSVFDLSNEPWAPRLKDWARNGATIDGKLLGLNIWSVDGWAMVYNTSIFDKYNLTPPKDYAEFLKICETLKTNGITPIYEMPSELWHASLYMSEAAAVVNYNSPGTYDKLNSGELKFVDIPEFKLSLIQLKELADKGYLGKDYMSNLWNDSFKAMGTGEYAMILGYSSYQSEVATGYPDSGAENFKMFPSPLGFTGEVKVWGTSAGGVVMVVNKDTKNLDLVRLWFEFRTRVENLKKFYADRADLGNPSFPEVDVKPTEGLRSITELVDGNFQLEGSTGILFFDIMTVGKYIEGMLLGASTPVQVLEQIDADREKLLEIVK